MFGHDDHVVVPFDIYGIHVMVEIKFVEVILDRAPQDEIREISSRDDISISTPCLREVWDGVCDLRSEWR